MPIASKGAPATSGRCCVADGGIVAPNTCEKETPARSKTEPSLMMRLSPPPPSGRCHGSRRHFAVSSASSASVMRSCKSTRYCLTASCTADYPCFFAGPFLAAATCARVLVGALGGDFCLSLILVEGLGAGLPLAAAFATEAGFFEIVLALGSALVGVLFLAAAAANFASLAAALCSVAAVRAPVRSGVSAAVDAGLPAGFALAPLRPHLPKLRTGAAASIV